MEFVWTRLRSVTDHGQLLITHLDPCVLILRSCHVGQSFYVHEIHLKWYSSFRLPLPPPPPPPPQVFLIIYSPRVQGGYEVEIFRLLYNCLPSCSSKLLCQQIRFKMYHGCFLGRSLNHLRAFHEVIVSARSSFCLLE